MKLGMIVRCDDGGLGIQTRDFHKHMKPDKTAVMKIGPYDHHPERYPDACQVVEDPWTDAKVRQFLQGLDVVWTIETPYNWSLFPYAREMGVKTILQINYEWLPDPPFTEPDLYVCPADWNIDKTPGPNVHIPNPVDTDFFKWSERKTAKTFVHVAGHQGGYGRNGTIEFMKAIPMVQNQDVKFIVWSQQELPEAIDKRVRDPRLEVRKYSVDDRRDLFKDADVMVYPRRYAGLSLQVDEALALGLPVLMSDMKPQSGYLPAEWRIPIQSTSPLMIKREVEFAEIDPLQVAMSIDRMAGTDIHYHSITAREIARARSWDAIKPRYDETIRRLVEG